MASSISLMLMLLWTVISLTLTNSEEAPQITIAPEEQKVLDNGISSFHCAVSGDPIPEIHWRKGGKRISRNRQRYMFINSTQSGYFSSVLRIEPAKSRDEGMFECRADNGVGAAASASARLRVYGQEVPAGFPRVTVGPTMKSVEKDHDSILECSVTGDPAPVIKWFKDFVPITPANDHISVLPSGFLQIQRTVELDEGKYECAGENNLGIAFSFIANLYVRGWRI